MGPQQSPGEWKRSSVFPTVALLLCLAGAILLNIPPEIFSQGYQPLQKPPAVPTPVVINGSPDSSPAGSPPAAPRAPMIPPPVAAGPTPPVPAIPPGVLVDPDAPLPTGPNTAAPDKPPGTLDGNPVRGDGLPPVITGLSPARAAHYPAPGAHRGRAAQRQRDGSADSRGHRAARVFARGGCPRATGSIRRRPRRTARAPAA